MNAPITVEQADNLIGKHAKRGNELREVVAVTLRSGVTVLSLADKFRREITVTAEEFAQAWKVTK